MKIDDSVKKPGGLPIGSAQTRSGKGADKAGGVGKSQPSSDSVHISSQLQSLESHLGGDSVFDAQKVEEIKAAIAGGHFQVNPEKVANGLLETVKDLLHTRTA